MKRLGITFLFVVCFLVGIAYPLNTCLAKKVDDAALQDKITETVFRLSSKNPAVNDEQLHQISRTFFQVYKQMLSAPPGKDGEKMKRETSAMMEKMFGKVWSKVDEQVKELTK